MEARRTRHTASTGTWAAVTAPTDLGEEVHVGLGKGRAAPRRAEPSALENPDRSNLAGPCEDVAKDGSVDGPEMSEVIRTW